MYCLGIETTAHTFGAAIVTFDGKVLANEFDVYKTDKGGMIPYKIAEHHVNVFEDILRKAIAKSGIKFKDISLISFSAAPGIGHALRIGAFVAKKLSYELKVPLIGVNHCIAHLEIGRLTTKSKDPVLLYVSGANTQVIAYDGGKYRIFGETLDMGIGNFLDQFARELGAGFPGGPVIEKLALTSKNYIELPYTVKGMDVSFGGLLTNLKQKIKSGEFKNEDLAYSAQETVFAMLLEVSERAMAHCEKKELLLGGGVACNKRFGEMANIMCKERGAQCFIPERQFLVDNPAMIAWLGILMFKAGNKGKIGEYEIFPYQRTDDVDVNWRE